MTVADEIEILYARAEKAERERDEAIAQALANETQAIQNLDRVKVLEAALVRSERKLSAYVGVCTGDKELTETILPMARAALAKDGEEQ